MKHIFCAVLALFLFTTVANAQWTHPMANKEGEILDKPVCSALVNRSDVSIQGTLSTAPQADAEGVMVRHRDNFKLKPGQKREFCAAGPFFEGRRLHLVIRTMIPLFECKTKIDKDIFLYSDVQDDDTRKYSANCR